MAKERVPWPKEEGDEPQLPAHPIICYECFFEWGDFTLLENQTLTTLTCPSCQYPLERDQLILFTGLAIEVDNLIRQYYPDAWRKAHPDTSDGKIK